MCGRPQRPRRRRLARIAPGPVAGARPVGCALIEGRAQNSDVGALKVGAVEHQRPATEGRANTAGGRLVSPVQL